MSHGLPAYLVDLALGDACLEQGEPCICGGSLRENRFWKMSRNFFKK